MRLAYSIEPICYMAYLALFAFLNFNVKERNNNMAFNDPMDIYCERLTAGLMAEPINLFSNLAFIVAGLLLIKKYCLKSRQSDLPGVRVLPLLLVAIGIGSSIFHSFATYWAQLADVIPIGIFLFVYLYYFFRYQVGLNKFQTALALVGFGALTLMLSKLADKELSNGSELYYGAWVTLFGMTCYIFGKSHFSKTRIAYMGALLSFTLSLFCRTIDMNICETLPIGTHFLWHLLNAYVIYSIAKEYLDHSTRGSATFTRSV